MELENFTIKAPKAFVNFFLLTDKKCFEKYAGLFEKCIGVLATYVSMTKRDIENQT